VEISYPEDWQDILADRWAQMRMSPEHYTKMRAERLAREAHAPAIGDPAPDFEIERLSAQGQRTGGMFQLSETRGKPVGLVFGSYT